MNNWIITKDKKWVDKWNEFVLSDKDSSFLQSLNRAKSYEKYGMNWELLLFVDGNDEILLGSANIIVKYLFFTIYVCSYGSSSNYTYKNKKFQEDYLQEFLKRAKQLKAFASQITILKDFTLKIEKEHFEKVLFNIISSPKYLNLINLKNDLGEYLSDEEIIASFSSKGRRDVRSSCRKGLISKFPRTEEEVKEAYSCIESNAVNKGYFVRDWGGMKDFIMDGIRTGMIYMISAWYGDKIQGVILLEKSSNYLNYSMGGVFRHKPDLLTGYFLQLESMKLSKELNLEFYNVSYGGPPKVQKFKNMFNPILEEKYKTIFFIHNKLKFLIFNFFYNTTRTFIFNIVKFKKRLF